ncbi:arginine--tRNA ligase [Agaricicola taiwanensis]|uniref:Arginine--tRNA ligase n=1 Tax=Agaricicola taiwanensis TaxID=591372 RepID=A0A8J3DXA9_9RHOB|nr:arginine--tRNA ligase [Agaricicola taiwanensis]GGE45321.1 arginine--tRNA ligase [Agaricicola taiwanensis]
MNIFSIFEERIKAAAQNLVTEGVLPQGADIEKIVVEPPRDASHGDIATNAALILAKTAGMKPRELAEALARKLEDDADLAKVDIAGPGFINLTLTPAFWPRVLRSVLAAGQDYGRGEANQSINVEYVSANPTGPMHVGHCRGAVFGDALANLLDFAGYDVTREYYINDAGAQVDVLARSAFLRYREALGEPIGQIPEGLYPGDYLVAVGKALAREHGPALKDLPESEWLPLVRNVAIDAMMAAIRDDLAALNITHDVFTSERSLSQPEDKIARMMRDLQARGLIYEGRLPPPKGQLPEDWEDREQTLFRATKFGDEIDRPLLKSDGSYTYFAADIAYHKDKIDRGFNHMIDVWGADHGGYVKRMRAAVDAVSDGHADLDVKLVQLVRLFRAGEPVKMSKRSGDFVTLREVVDEVGRDAVRFMMLYRKNDAVLDFDFAKVVEQSRDNAVFYVQYAHARASSILRNSIEAFGEEVQSTAPDADFDQLNDAGEVKLIKRLAEYPRLIESAASAHEPHRVAFYLYELASELHAHWNRGKDSPHLRFIIENDKELSKMRLGLVRGIRNILASGLALLGVTAPQEMR